MRKSPQIRCYTHTFCLASCPQIMMRTLYILGLYQLWQSCHVNDCDCVLVTLSGLVVACLPLGLDSWIQTQLMTMDF
jgi:hypothetical protein